MTDPAEQATRSKIILGWIYWGLYQTLASFVMVIGWLALLLPAACHAWHDRPSRTVHYPGTVAAWDPIFTAMTGGVAGCALGLILGGGWAIALALLGAISGAVGLWDNEEDGVTGSKAYRAAHDKLPLWLIAYIWSAWRNSDNDFRFLPLAFLVIDAKQIVVDAGTTRTVIAHGWRQYVLYHPKWLPVVLRAGWLINPDAASGDYAWPVAGIL